MRPAIIDSMLRRDTWPQNTPRSVRAARTNVARGAPAWRQSRREAVNLLKLLRFRLMTFSEPAQKEKAAPNFLRFQHGSASHSAECLLYDASDQTAPLTRSNLLFHSGCR